MVSGVSETFWVVRPGVEVLGGAPEGDPGWRGVRGGVTAVGGVGGEGWAREEGGAHFGGEGDGDGMGSVMGFWRLEFGLWSTMLTRLMSNLVVLTLWL